jgi:uncharacterized protein YbbK (DUF523 family)
MTSQISHLYMFPARPAWLRQNEKYQYIHTKIPSKATPQPRNMFLETSLFYNSPKIINLTYTVLHCLSPSCGSSSDYLISFLTSVLTSDLQLEGENGRMISLLTRKV